MKTVAINVMNLCVPCENRCRYCLLSYDGNLTGVDYKRSEQYAGRFYQWLRKNRPELSFLFGFGYSMEHSDLTAAITFCQSTGSVTGEFLQFNGMKFRTEEALRQLLQNLKDRGIKLIDLTFYGTEAYHDRFAARSGDFRLMMDTLRVANQVGLDVTVGIPITSENANQMEALLTELEKYHTQRIACFVPHSEGRGGLLEPVRFRWTDYENLPENIRKHINRNIFKTEREWLEYGFPQVENRVLTLMLTPENVDFFEKLPFEDAVAYLEKLDDDYFSVIPSAEILATCYGDTSSDKFYSARDLYMRYQRQYIAEKQLEIYDIHDERNCFSRRI